MVFSLKVFPSTETRVCWPPTELPSIIFWSKLGVFWIDFVNHPPDYAMNLPDNLIREPFEPCLLGSPSCNLRNHYQNQGKINFTESKITSLNNF
jgi:hypothetical protein